MNKILNYAIGFGFVILTLGSTTALAKDLSWSSAKNLSEAGEDARVPQVAISDDGTKATAVWYRYNSDTNNHEIQTSSATIENGISAWGPVTDLSTSGLNAQQPNIAVSSDGTKATAVWYQDEGSTDIAQSASATIVGNVATWSAINNLSATDQDLSNKVQIGLSDDGTRATAIWTRSSGSPDFDRIVQSSSATITGNSAAWGPVYDLSDIGASAQENDFALSSDGTKATAVWHRSNGSNSIIQSASATITGNTASWSAVSDLSAAGGSAIDAIVELTADGTVAAVIWARDDGSDDITQSAFATISGNSATWGAVSDLSAAGGYSYGGQIAISSDGTKVTAVWVRDDGKYYFSQTRSATLIGNSATWGSTVNLSADESDADYPYVILSSDGLIAVAIWEVRNGSSVGIHSAQAAISGNTAAWGRTKNLSGYSAADARFALSNDGEKAVAIWSHNNGTDRIIQSVSAPIETDCFVIKSSNDKTIIFCL